MDQYVFVIPSLDMMVVRLGVTASREADTLRSVFTSKPGEFEHEWFRMLMGAFKGPRPAPDPGLYDHAHTDYTLPTDPESGLLYSLQHPEDIPAGSGQ